MILRGVPRGRLSAAGAPFFDPRDDEVLLGYPFSGGDLIGPQGNGGLTTPLVLVQAAEGPIVALSSLDDRVRTKRIYFQPGESGYRVEALVEAEGWNQARSLQRAGLADCASDDDCGGGGAALRAHRDARSAFRAGTLAATCRTGCAAPRSSSRCTACTTRATCSTTTRGCSRSCGGWRRRFRRSACSCSSRRGTAATTGTIRTTQPPTAWAAKPASAR